jgi:hypothetical protein
MDLSVPARWWLRSALSDHRGWRALGPGWPFPGKATAQPFHEHERLVDGSHEHPPGDVLAVALVGGAGVRGMQPEWLVGAAGASGGQQNGSHGSSQPPALQRLRQLAPELLALTTTHLTVAGIFASTNEGKPNPGASPRGSTRPATPGA